MAMDILVSFARFLVSIPPELAIVVLAMLPFGELRGALPVALTVYNMSIPEAMFWSVVGNMLPVYFLLVFFERATLWVRQRSRLADDLLNKLFERTRRQLHDQVGKYGIWALAIFVAIPFPATGAWTGALGAFVFGLPKKRAFLSILAGVIIAAVIVTAVTTGAVITIQSLL